MERVESKGKKIKSKNPGGKPMDKMEIQGGENKVDKIRVEIRWKRWKSRGVKMKSKIQGKKPQGEDKILEETEPQLLSSTPHLGAADRFAHSARLG